jgi:hypothetical protein
MISNHITSIINDECWMMDRLIHPSMKSRKWSLWGIVICMLIVDLEICSVAYTVNAWILLMLPLSTYMLFQGIVRLYALSIYDRIRMWNILKG